MRPKRSKTLRPPLFYRRVAAFNRALGLWSGAAIAAAFEWSGGGGTRLQTDRVAQSNSLSERGAGIGPAGGGGSDGTQLTKIRQLSPKTLAVACDSGYKRLSAERSFGPSYIKGADMSFPARARRLPEWQAHGEPLLTWDDLDVVLDLLADVAPDWSAELNCSSPDCSTIVVLPEGANHLLGPAFVLHRDDGRVRLDQFRWDKYRQLGVFQTFDGALAALRVRLVGLAAGSEPDQIAPAHPAHGHRSAGP